MDTIDEIRKDPALRRAYKDNIAMSFKDNLSWYKKETGKKNKDLTNEDFHIISNKSADYFLDLLLKHTKVAEFDHSREAYLKRGSIPPNMRD